MKKILLTTAAVAVLATSSAYAAEGDFYVKAQGGFAKINKLKVAGHSFKSKNTGFLGVAAGYNVMDNVRVELALDHFFKPEFKGTNNLTISRTTTEPAYKADVASKIKFDVNTLLLNGFVDVADLGVAKIFVGAGVGIARGSSKVTETWKNGTGVEKSSSIKGKSSTVFSGAAYLGASTEITPGIHGELTYSYRHIAKIVGSSKAFSAHNIGAGVRFEI